MNIHEQITLKDIKILIGDDVIIILPQSWDKPLTYIDFYAIVKYFLNLNKEIKVIFGLFNDPFIKLIRKKIKQEFINKFSKETMLAFFEGDNKEAYYVNKEVAEKILGLEIRYNENHGLKNNKMYLIKELIGKMGVEEKKALEVEKNRI